MIDKVEGYIISESEYGETSKIINVITKDKGIIGIMVKGAKKIKSPFFNKVSKFTKASFNIKYKKDKISTLISIDIIDYFKNIKTDIEKVTYASIISELVTQISKHESNSDIYEIYDKSIKKINEGISPLGITDIFKLKMLTHLGVDLHLDSCAICGSKKNIITISCNNGGYICKECYKNEKIVSENAIKLIYALYHINIENITKFDVNDITLNEVSHFIDDYYETYTGIYLKSSNFLNILERVN